MSSNSRNDPKAPKALQWKRPCMAIRALLCKQEHGLKKKQCDAGKNTQICMYIKYDVHNAQQDKNTTARFTSPHTASALHTALDTCWTHTPMTPLPPSPECRVFPQPPVWAPDVQFYELPMFPVPERSAGADPDLIDATPRPHTGAKGHPNLDTIEQDVITGSMQ